MEHGLQKKIAIAAGISPQFFNRILNRLRNPSWLTAKKLAEATGTKPDLWFEASSREEIEAQINISQKDTNAKHSLRE